MILGFFSKEVIADIKVPHVSPNENPYFGIVGDPDELSQTKWDRLLNSDQYLFGKEPAEILRKYIPTIPVGRALDIAMGEGRNAVFLAQKGFDVEGVDYSPSAIRKAKRLAREKKVPITAVMADLNDYSIKPNYYDLILNVNYLQRNLFDQIKRGLKSGGIVIFENPSSDQPGSGAVLQPDSLLVPGELLEQFKDFEILHFSASRVDSTVSERIVAKKP